jgi:glycosyltransferase involved in cell wall biosynthesis
VTLPHVTLLLSSYDGEQFIGEQIASIQKQTHSGWTLLVRDDGSSDGTQDIIQGFARQDPRITLLRDDRGNLGPVASFGLLLEHAVQSGAEYVALADQDDVWSSTKLAGELELLLRHERRSGPDKPLLVHTDLAIVGEDLSPIHPSFLAYQGLQHQDDFPLGPLLIQNFVTGCTVLFNRALLKAAVPVPGVFMHDWWLALCCAALGEILYLPEATVQYRQHGRNALGSTGLKQAVWRSLRHPIAAWQRSDAFLEQALQQAQELITRVEREQHNNPFAGRSLGLLRDFCRALTDAGGLTRLRVLARHRIRPRTFLPYPVRFYAGVLLWSRGRPRPPAPTLLNSSRQGQGGAPAPR